MYVQVYTKHKFPTDVYVAKINNVRQPKPSLLC